LESGFATRSALRAGGRQLNRERAHPSPSACDQDAATENQHLTAGHPPGDRVVEVTMVQRRVLDLDDCLPGLRHGLVDLRRSQRRDCLRIGDKGVRVRLPNR
jgi:hypothetical protein